MLMMMMMMMMMMRRPSSLRVRAKPRHLPYIYNYRYIDIYIIYLNKHVYIYTGICTSQKIANFPGFKIQNSRFWGKLLESRPGLGFKKFFLES